MFFKYNKNIVLYEFQKGALKKKIYLLFDKSGGYISIGESIEEAVLVIVGLDRIVFTLIGKTNTGLGAKQTTNVNTTCYKLKSSDQI
jgi:hypothetical protein